MKRLLLILCLATASFAFVACHQPPSARVVQVQTLKAVGQSAEAAVALTAQRYRDGRITAAQALQVSVFYDNKFQPVYRLAVAAVNSNLNSVASPDVLALATQLATLVTSFQVR